MELSDLTISIIIIACTLLLYVLGCLICDLFCSRRFNSLDSPRDNSESDNELIDVSHSIIEVSHGLSHGLSNRIIEIKNIEIVKAYHETNSDSIDLPEANMI